MFSFNSTPSGHSSPFGSSFTFPNASGTATGVVGTTSSFFQTSDSQSASAFGSSSGSGFSSTPAFGIPSSASGHSSLFGSSFAIPNASGTATSVVGTTSSLFQTFGSQSAPAFAFGSSASGSGFSLTPAFEIPSSASGNSTGNIFCGNTFGGLVSSFGIPNASGTATGVVGTTSSLFGSSFSFPNASGTATGVVGTTTSAVAGTTCSSGTSALGQKPAFGASNTTGVCFSFPPTVGQSTALFGKNDLFGSTQSSLGTRSSFSGSLFSTPPFGSLTKGSRVATYASTTDEESRKLVSISAMPIFKNKSHEELRCEDYQSGDKGNFNPKPNAFFSVPASVTPFTSTSNIFPLSNDSSCATCPPYTCPYNSLAPKNSFSNTTGVCFSFPPTVGQSTALFGKNDLFGSTQSSLGTRSSFSGSLFSTPPFGSLTKGSRVATYASTTDEESRKLVSISSMPIFKNKSHEELRCEDYQSGDKGNFNPKPNAFFSVPASVTPFTSTSNIFPLSNDSSCATCPPYTCPYNSLAPKNSFSFKSPFNNSSSPFCSTSSSSSIQAYNLVNPFSFPTTSMHTPTISAFSVFSAPSLTSSLATSSFTPSQLVPPHASPFGPTSRSLPIQSSTSLSTLPVNPSPFSPSSNHFPIQSLSFTINVFQPSPFANFPSTTSSYTPAIVTVSAPSSCSISASEFSPGLTFTFNQPTSMLHSSAPNRIRGVTVTEAGGQDNAAQESGSQTMAAGQQLSGVNPFGSLHFGNGEIRCGNVATSYSEKHKMEHTDDSTKERNLLLKVRDVEVLLPRLQTFSYYYTEPRIQELAAKERAEPGFCSHVKNFVVGRHGYGSIKFMGETDVRCLDLESIVLFNHGGVIVYKDKNKKPAVGEGLNKPAEVTLLNIKCFDEKTGNWYMDGPLVEKYREKLKKSAEEQGAEFVSYDPVGGEWKFRVQHF